MLSIHERELSISKKVETRVASADRPPSASNRSSLDSIKVYRVPSPHDNSARGEVPMPSDEEVTLRAGSLQALTGLTAADFQA